jgi:hypothetical protein
MNFYLVFTKNRKKFDKYVKVNKIKNKIIIDIKEYLEEYELINDYEIYKEYFNIIVYTKIVQTFSKNKDVYYLPNFTNKSMNINEILKIKSILGTSINFNILLFYDEFRDDVNVNNILLSNMHIFDASQILKSY